MCGRSVLLHLPCWALTRSPVRLVCVAHPYCCIYHVELSPGRLSDLCVWHITTVALTMLGSHQVACATCVCVAHHYCCIYHDGLLPGRLCDLCVWHIYTVALTMLGSHQVACATCLCGTSLLLRLPCWALTRSPVRLVCVAHLYCCAYRAGLSSSHQEWSS